MVEQRTENPCVPSSILGGTTRNPRRCILRGFVVFMPCGVVPLDLFRVRWSVSGKLGSGGNPICVVREPDYEENRLVRTKTFSTHNEPKICHVVRKSCVFTHGKNSHEGGVVALKRHFVLWCARRGWSLWRFASLIPSGWRLTPIHKVMGDHASRGPTPTPQGLL